jgi:TolA-binding protein
MATTSRRKKKPAYFPEEHDQKEWFQEAQEHVSENLWQYVIGVGVVVAAALVGGLYNAHTHNVDARAATAYAEAMQEEDESARLEALAAAKDYKGAARPRILYMLGETAFDLGEYDRAEEAFSALQAEYPDHELTPRGVEGLGYLALARENYDAAAGYFEEIRTKWPTSPEALRQSLNLGRVSEAREDYEAAAASYEEQQTVFPESAAAEQAETALARLEISHPQAFGLETPTPPEQGEQAAAETETAGMQSSASQATPAEVEAEVEALEAEVEALPETTPEIPEEGAQLTLPDESAAGAGVDAEEPAAEE